jgi:hypothetical protein
MAAICPERSQRGRLSPSYVLPHCTTKRTVFPHFTGSTRRHIQKDGILHSHICENFKSYKFFLSLKEK